MAECRSVEMAVGVILRNLGAVELREPRHMIQMTGLKTCVRDFEGPGSGFERPETLMFRF